MKHNNYDKPENIKKRSTAYRQRMRDKGWKYLCVFVPPEVSDEVNRIIAKWKEENIIPAPF